MAKIKGMIYKKKGVEWKIRNANEDDAENIIILIQQLESETEFMLREEGEFKISLEDEISYIKEKLDSTNQFILVCEIDNKLVGILNFEGNVLKRYRHQGKFSMGILKSFWGYTIGSSLISEMIKWCKENHIKRISLEVLESNMRARKLYQKFNFKPEGVLKKDCYYGENRYENTIIMACLLYDN
jgi:RimJ/RimL family protein N-acetyltransferase